MVGFSGILGIVQAKDQRMIKDKLIDRKKLLVDLQVNNENDFKMLIVNMIIIQFHLRLDKILLHWGYELTEEYFLMS